MALDKNKSTRLVHWPDGKPSVETDATATGTVEFLSRNKKTYAELSGLTGVATVNLASTFDSDPDDKTYTIRREDGFELILIVVADGAYAVTLGTGFGVATSVTSVNGTKLFKFEYINGAYELIGTE